MRVMYLRSTTRKPKGSKSEKNFHPKSVRMHRLVCPREWDGFQLEDVIQDVDGFRWEYRNFEMGEATRPIAKIMAAKSKIPPVVFHWRFKCESCGELALVKMGASWRPTRRKCFTCNPASKWREAYPEEDKAVDAVGKAQEAENGCEG